MKSPFIEADEICERAGMSKQTLKKKIDAGTFPAPLRLHLRRRVWMRSQIEGFLKLANKNQSNKEVDA